MANMSKHVVFALFNAENYAFAGSQRFVQDLTSPFECKSTTKTAACDIKGVPACAEPCFPDLDFQKINFDRIESIIEFDSVATMWLSNAAATRPSIYMHVDSINNATTSLMNQFAGTTSGSSFNGTTITNLTILPAYNINTGTNNRLPPSSAMAFLQKRSIPAVIFSDYQNTFSNKYTESLCF